MDETSSFRKSLAFKADSFLETKQKCPLPPKKKLIIKNKNKWNKQNDVINQNNSASALGFAAFFSWKAQNGALCVQDFIL